MIIKTKELFSKKTIKKFAKEIYENHFAYRDDIPFKYPGELSAFEKAENRASEILNDIKDCGLKTEIIKFKGISQLDPFGYKSFEYINLEYLGSMFGSELRWSLFN
jgi:hypothetical protein